MEPRQPATLPTGSAASRRRPVIVREISAQQTYALRHAVLWPDKPMAYVQLPDDEAGQHFGAFISISRRSSSRNGEPGINHNSGTDDDDNNNDDVADPDPDQDNANNAKDNANPSHSPSTCGSGAANPTANPNLEAGSPGPEAKAEAEEELLISALSLFVTPSGSEARIRKFATASRWQGRGAGTALLRRRDPLVRRPRLRLALLRALRHASRGRRRGRRRALRKGWRGVCARVEDAWWEWGLMIH